MPNLGAGEILVILLLALLVLGPDKLPGAARSIGKGMTQLRKLSSGFEQEVRSAMHSVDGDGATSSASSATPTSTLHPGLGPGPRLGPGAVVLDGSGSDTTGIPSSAAGTSHAGTPQADVRITGDGPSGSFS